MLENIAILLVEDDPVFRNLVSSFLDSRGAKVTEAEDGAQGITLFKQAKFDIILADLSMPVMGGLDMLKTITKLGIKIPTIIISGNQVMADVIEALRLGASDYLVKPVADLKLIEHAINQCITKTSSGQNHFKNIEEISYQELEDNLALLERNAAAAQSIQQQLFPPSQINLQEAVVDYSLYQDNSVSAYFIDTVSVDEQYLLLYMAHFHPQDNRAAFASVLLKSFINLKLKHYRSGESQEVIEADRMLTYLNQRMTRSGIELCIDIIYAVVNIRNLNCSIAQAGSGLRCYIKQQQQLTPLILAETLPLGVAEWGEPTSHKRVLSLDEKLCICTNKMVHKQSVLANQFHGLIYDKTLPTGGFVQLSL